jgi:hypothetical protein
MQVSKLYFSHDAEGAEAAYPPWLTSAVKELEG